jgi:hypothetical protein
VLRGGSFNNTTRNVRCAYRNQNNPNNRNNNNGFRVCVSTFFVGYMLRFSKQLSRSELWRGYAFATETRKMAEPVPGRVRRGI